MPFVFAALALASGVVLAALGLPSALSALSFLPLAALFALWSRARSPGEAARLAFVAGLGFYVAHLLWLPESFGAGFGPVGALMFLPVYALEAAFWALAVGLAVRLAPRAAARPWLFAFGWVLMEWLRTLGPLAFPWGTLGYTLLPLPAVQAADLVGALGLSLLVTGLAASLARALSGEPRPLLAALGVWMAVLGYGVLVERSGAAPWTSAAGEGRALLLRTTFDSFDKANARVDTFGRQLELSAEAREGEVIVWSETAVLNPLDLARLPRRPMLTGLRVPNGNAAIAWDGTGETSRYLKTKLVPFGEYFPLARPLEGLYRWIFARLGLYFERTDAGTRAAPLVLGGRSYGTYICYDSVFGGVTAALVRRGAGVLVNVSNDGWYGSSAGVEQHFQMGRLRAIETRRFVLRSVNLGVAAVVDPLGKPVQRFDGPGESALHAEFGFREGLTPYVRVGDWPVVGACVLGILLARRARREYVL